MRFLLSLLVLFASVSINGAEADASSVDRFGAWLQERAAGLVRGAALTQGESDRGQTLARGRRAAMRALMMSDPRQAAARAVPADQAGALPQAIRQHLERRVSGVGRLMSACRMPAEDAGHDEHGHVCSARAEIVRELHLEGVAYQAQVFGRWQEARNGDYQVAEALVLDGVAVLGAADPVAAAAPAPGMAPLPAELPTNQLSARKTLYYIAMFADETVYPLDAATANSRMQVTSDFFRNNTQDQMYLTALKGTTDGGSLMDIVYITLPANASTYTTDFNGLLNAARSRAQLQGFLWSDYNFDVVVTTNKGAFSYAGIAWLGSQGCHLRSDYSTLRTAGHELGHNVGLSHAYYWRTDATHPFGEDTNPGGYAADTSLAESIEYGHYFSMMGAQTSGEMSDATKPHFSPMEKQILGWYSIGSTSASQTQTIASSGTYRVYRHDTKLQTGTPRGLRIESPATVYTGSTGYKYWLSYRYAPWTSATGQVQSGLQLEVTAGSYPIQLDATPYSNDDNAGSNWNDDNTDKRDGALRLGRTYSDKGGAIHITPVARNTATAGEEYIDVVVNLGTYSGNQAPVIADLTQSATAVATGVAVNFAVTASDPDGDTLAYGWSFDPVTAHVESGLNATTASTSWSTAGQYRVTVTVSDMKGGRASRTAVVKVGTPASVSRIAGRVLWGGRPVADARVAVGSTAQAWTSTDGTYVLTGLAAGSHTLTCAKDDLTFTAKFANPTTVADAEYAVGRDFWANEAYQGSGSAATYSVSGTVTDAGAGMTGVTVMAGGKSTTSGAGGTWSLTGIPAGTWPVTAWAPNAVFNAVSATVTTGNVSGITVVRTRRTIAGRVNLDVAGVSVTVQAGGASVTGTTVKVGSKFYYDYTLSVPAGSWTVAASAAAYRFTPSGFTNPVNASAANQSGCDFAFTAGTSYQIRGTVQVGTLAVSGVTVTTAGATAITGPDGSYVLGNLPAGGYTVTPTLSGGVFTPTSRSLTITTADLTAQNFTLTDAAPTVATAAAASPASVATPTGSTTLSVLGADNSGESTLIYTWSATAGPYPVTFSANGTNAAKSTIATFQGAGSYTFSVIIRDIRQQTATSTVGVTVQSSGSGNLVTVSPHAVEMIFGDSVQFTATAWDAAGTIVAGTPVWSTSGGSISTGGLYTATAAGATYTVTATLAGATGEAYATIIGTGEPTVTVTASDATASEPGLGLGGGTLTFTRNIGLGAVTISYEAGGTGTATAGSDYSALSGTVSMADGQTTATVAITVLDDALAEPHETVVVNLLVGTGYQIGGSGTTTVTIKDDEPNSVTIATTDATASEPAIASGNGVYRVTRTGNPDAALTVNLTMGGLVAGADYSGIGTTATIAAGATTVDLTLIPADDAISELAETAILSIDAGTGYVAGAPASATVTILDDDADVATVDVGDTDCQEASSNNGTFIVTRLGNRAAALTVNWTVGGTATNGTDYVSLTGSVSVAANSNTATVTVDPIDDTAYEGSETVTLTVASGSGYTVGSPSTASVDLLDNDKPTVSIAATDAIGDESGATAAFTVSRTGVTTLGSLIVAYTATGTAVSGVDYQALSGTVTIPNGQAGATIVLTPVQDAVTEVPETVIVTLSAQAAYTIAASPGNTATAMITDDTEAPLLSITASDATTSEPGKGDGTGAFTITRAGSPSLALTAGLVIGGTAASGSDFSAVAATASLASGVTTIVVTVTPLDDATAEPDETVIATLVSGTGYTVGTPGAATVNLYDDEAAQVVVEVSDAQAAEAATANAGSWILRRLGLRSAALTVPYTMGGTAVNGTDYASLSGSASLAANIGSATVTLTPSQDAVVEGTETAVLTIGAGVGYAVGAPSTGTVEIADDEVVDVTVSIPDAVCGEPSNTGSFRITRSAVSASALTVNYTVSGTATAGGDYVALAGTATIAANATSVDVTVTPSDDGIVESAESVIVTLALNGSAYDLGATRVATLWIADDEVPTVTIATTDAVAAEPADNGLFTLTCTPAPAANLTVAYTIGGSAANGGDCTALTGVAVIAAGTTTATIPVAVIDDQLGEGSETITVTLATGSGYNVGTTAAQTVTIAANDLPTASIVASDASAAEAGLNTGQFTIQLTNPASASVAVSYTVGGTATPTSDYAALSGSLTIAAGQTSGTVTVTPLDDAAVEGSETVTVTLSTSASYGLGTSSASVGIADDDSATTQGIVLSTTAATVSEGGTASFSVQLQIAPAGDTVVTIARTAGDADLGVASGSSLTFTAGNWNVPQTVTLAAAEDADFAHGTATITASSAGLPNVTLAATEGDNDTQSLVVSSSAVTVSEGASAGFTVRLNAQPTADTVVTVARTSGDADLSVSGGATLTFTTGNWSTPQTVTLSAAEDADVANGGATMTVSSTGLTSAQVAATESDNDTQTLIVSTAGVSVPEGSTASFTVRLAYQPAASTTVSVAWTGGDADLTVSAGGTLTFTSANYAVPQQVTLAAAEDADLVAGTATITVSSASLSNVTVTATEADNDAQGLVVSAGTLGVPEGASATFTVRLNADPGAATTVSVAWTSGDGDLGITGGSSLVFSTADWMTPQTVTVSAAQDDDAADGSANLTVSSAGMTTVPVTATEADDDTLALVVSSGAVTVPEGATASFQVRLAAAPASAVSVLVSRTAGDADLDVSAGAILTFSALDWNVDQTVTLLAGQDADVSDGQATITISSAGMPDAEVVASENDDDVQALALSTGTIAVAEGSTATFTVSLAFEPTADTTVTVVRSSGDGDLSVAGGGSLIFTGADWSTPQTVTLGAAADADTASGTAVITLSASGLADATVTANEIDDDVLALVAASTAVTVLEGGTGAIQVSLNAEPTGPVTVGTAVVSGDADITIASGSSLSFGIADWNIPQTVLLAGAEDADAAQGSATVTLSSTGLADIPVTATESDNDILAIVVSASTLAVPEGGTATFTVQLSVAPPADTTVPVDWISGDADLTVAGGASLVFTTANWSTPQTVTVAAAEDGDAAAGTAVIAASSTGLSTQTITATETDNDVQGLVATPAIVFIAEGTTSSFSVQLAAAPASTTTVGVAVTAGDADVTVGSGPSLVFTPANWATPQQVTIAAAEDADLANGGATITLSATGLPSSTVQASEIDNDTQSLVVSPASLVVPEGSQSTCVISLAYQPSADVTVAVGWASGDADITVTGGATLLFTTANWSIPQTATFAAAQDADAVNGSAGIDVSSAGLVTVSVVATEVDDEMPAVILSAATVAVAEGSTGACTVRLSAAPAATATVTVARTAGDADITVLSGAILVFTTTDWMVEQTVQFAAAEDADALHGSATITASSPGLAGAALVAVETDNDTPAILVSAATLPVAEGLGASLGVVLAAAPAATTTIQVVVTGGDADITVASGATLVFTPANWNITQSAVVAAAQDADQVNGSATIRLSGSGPAPTMVVATEIDDDAPAGPGVVVHAGSSQAGCGAGALGLLLGLGLLGVVRLRRRHA